MKPIFERYEKKTEFPRLTRVEIVDDDFGWYIVSEASMEVLDITFKNPGEARHHANCEDFVVVL